MEELPVELWSLTFSFLSPQDTPSVCRVCSLWNILWNDPLLWKSFHDRALGGTPQPPLQHNQWKESFKQKWNYLADLKNERTFLRWFLAYSPIEKEYARQVSPDQLRLLAAIGCGSPVLMQNLERVTPLLGIPHNIPLLGFAARSGEVEMVKVLQDGYGINIQMDGIYQRKCLLSFACERRHNLSVIQYLVDQGAAINNSSDSPLTYLVVRGCLEEVMWLCDKGARVSDALRLLFRALSVSTNTTVFEMLRYMLLSAIRNQETINGSILNEGLHNLITTSPPSEQKALHIEIIELLIKVGASLDKPDRTLHMLMECNTNSEALQDIVLHNIKQQHTNRICCNGPYTSECFKTARLKKNPHEFMQRMIDAGMDINASDQNGFTALQVAARFSWVTQMELLLELGADPQKTGKKGRPLPMYYAQLAKDKEMEDLLEKYLPADPALKRKLQGGKENLWRA